MQRTMGETWWTDLRWRVALQLVLWGMKVAPDGDAKDALVDSNLKWIGECKRQWNLRCGA
jgi:hypothetical protein